MKEDKITEKNLIEAEKDTSLGFIRCVICGNELEMTKKFAEVSGVSSASCTECTNTPELYKFQTWLHHFKDVVKLSNEETKERLRGMGYFL